MSESTQQQADACQCCGLPVSYWDGDPTDEASRFRWDELIEAIRNRTPLERSPEINALAAKVAQKRRERHAKAVD